MEGNHLESLVRVAGRLRTPLTLAGLTALILYLIYEQVLGLPVLTPLQSSDTFAVVDSIVSKVFWLAVLAVVLGFAGFVLTALVRLRPPLKRSAVSLVSTSLDPALSEPAEPARFEVIGQRFAVGAIDCKFVNRGDATAVLDAFSVRVAAFTLDRTPVLSLDQRVVRGALSVRVHNTGWGPARNVRLRLADPLLPDLFGARATGTAPVVGPGATTTVLTLEPDAALAATISELRRRRRELLDALAGSGRDGDDEVRRSPEYRVLLSDAERDRPPIARHWLSLGPPLDRLPVRVVVEGTHETPDGEIREIARTELGSDPLWLDESGFSYDHHLRLPAMRPASEVYAVVLGARAGERRDYALSRTIEPGGAERFHVALASVSSGTYEISLGFRVDGRDEVWSAPLAVPLWRPRDAPLPRNLTDGAVFEMRDGRLELGGTGSVW
ncbi:hypothetical protein [Amycolatopsis granulosa]|uniref:hypothetical protein n=1 Tax=Amycolatopsis granulosa TaxID=185684 RepID=UPI00141DBC16|nr:hypothetical protein [Amycolatopsis granulosa]NIH87973.1 hypothetical protein [Amycolatopsis granulosa]